MSKKRINVKTSKIPTKMLEKNKNTEKKIEKL